MSCRSIVPSIDNEEEEHQIRGHIQRRTPSAVGWLVWHYYFISQETHLRNRERTKPRQGDGLEWIIPTADGCGRSSGGASSVDGRTGSQECARVCVFLF